MQMSKMSRGTWLTFEEGCNKYLENCRQRNLREGTIDHYTLYRKLAYGFSSQLFVPTEKGHKRVPFLLAPATGIEPITNP